MQGIYSIINKYTNDFYIGSAMDVVKRLRNHLKVLEKNRHPNKRLQYGYNHYGLEFVLIQRVRYKEDLIDREQKWIDYYESHSDYNILSEAGSSLGYTFKMKSAAKKRISRSIKKSWKDLEVWKRHSKGRKGKGRGVVPWNKGKIGIYSEYTLRKIRKVRKHQISPMKGRHHTEKTKLRISKSKKGKSQSEKQKIRTSKAIKLWWKNVGSKSSDLVLW